MKLLAPIFLLIVVTTAQAQQLARDEVDRFTFDTITETVPEYLYGGLVSPSMEVNILRINSDYFLELRIGGPVVYISTDDIFYLIVNRENVIKLNPVQSGLSDGVNIGEFILSDRVYIGEYIGGSAYHVSLDFALDEDLIDLFRDGLVSAVRMTTTSGYIEEDIKAKSYDLIGRHIKAVERLSDFRK